MMLDLTCVTLNMFMFNTCHILAGLAMWRLDLWLNFVRDLLMITALVAKRADCSTPA